MRLKVLLWTWFFFVGWEGENFVCGVGTWGILSLSDYSSALFFSALERNKCLLKQIQTVKMKNPRKAQSTGQIKYWDLENKTTHYVREALPWEKCSFFEHCSKGLWPPPPFIWTFVLFCRGCFLNAFLSIDDAPPYTMARMSSPHLKCCINVGFREAPCKKSFGILASYWTPPKIK